MCVRIFIGGKRRDRRRTPYWAGFTKSSLWCDWYKSSRRAGQLREHECTLDRFLRKGGTCTAVTDFSGREARVQLWHGWPDCSRTFQRIVIDMDPSVLGAQVERGTSKTNQYCTAEYCHEGG